MTNKFIPFSVVVSSCGGIILETATQASSDLIIKPLRDPSVHQCVMKKNGTELL